MHGRILHTLQSYTSAFVVEVRTITTTLRCSLPKSFCNYFHNFISLYVKKLAKTIKDYVLFTQQTGADLTGGHSCSGRRGPW